MRQRLHHLVYLLRGTLDPQGQWPGLLRSSGDGVLQLATDALWVDVPAFERAAGRGAAGPWRHGHRQLRAAGHGNTLAEALALYAGPLLPDEIDDPALHGQRQRLERLQGRAAARPGR
ncbi:hypothetical protein PEC18_29885, partial [Paucibacter sp. O1-1]|nr:hypothetical protein [Paucibacter sp. O1-1]MDA3829938.1 hypothetical protein [Paucibacter sp. O1-1]